MKTPLVHKHLIIRAEVENAPVDPDYISNEWLPNLISDIGMKILSGPFAIYCDVEGNKGLTAVVIIETSHCAIHTWIECDPQIIQLDVYTCGPLDPMIVNLALSEFNPLKVEMKYLDREHSLIELPLPTEEEIDEYNKEYVDN